MSFLDGFKAKLQSSGMCLIPETTATTGNSFDHFDHVFLKGDFQDISSSYSASKSEIKFPKTYDQNDQNCSLGEVEGGFDHFDHTFPEKKSENAPSIVHPSPAPYAVPILNDRGEFSMLAYLERWGAIFTLAGGSKLEADLSGMRCDEDRAGAQRSLDNPSMYRQIIADLRARAGASSGVLQ